MESGAEWDICTWVQGFEGATVHAALAEVLHRSRPKDGRAQYEWCRELAGEAEKEPGLIASMLGTALVETVSAVLLKQLHALREQEAATAKEKNDKFMQDAKAQFKFGEREDFDKGLNELIGFPNDEKVVAAMYLEHCGTEIATKTIYAHNYGITTNPLYEWKAAAGRWTPEDPSFEAEEGFKTPQETRNLSPKHFRQIIPLTKLMDPPTAEELREWKNPTAEEQERWDSEEREPCDEPAPREAALIRRGRRCAWRAGLTAAEVLAVRMWSGPMFVDYNATLRGRVRGEFTTTLHAVHSGIYKLSKVTPPGKVYRGVANRAITDKDFKAGHFVEMGAQSFTLDKNVALTYSGGSDSAASYLFEVQEGEVDRGADISSLSYYPEEREKLYGALSMMQVVGDRVERGTVVLKMRLNVNAKAGTIDEVVNRKHTWLKASAEMLLREAKSAPAVFRLEETVLGASRLGELQALLLELQEETEPWRFNDSEVFMQWSRALTDTWKGVLRHAELLEAVEGLLGTGTAPEGDSMEGPEMEEAAALKEAERTLLGLRARARLGRLPRRLAMMRFCQMTGLVRLWQLVVWLLLLVYIAGVMWVPWIILWILDTVLSTLSVGFFSGPLVDLQAHWLMAFWVFYTEPFSSLNGSLDPDRLPWASTTLTLWGAEVIALNFAFKQLQQAAADADGVVRGELTGLGDELRRAEEAVRKLWASGGLRVKERMGGNLRRTVMEALAGLSTMRLAEEHRGERFRKAVEHLVESCGELPMDDRATRVQFCRLRDLLRSKLGPGSQRSQYLEQKFGWMGEGDGLKRRSVSRLLELFKAGTDASTVTFRSSEVEDDWEAEHAGFFMCSCEYLDGFPLDQLCTGKLTGLEALALSRQQAAMLARFVTIHAPGDVTLTVGEQRVGVQFGKGAEAELFGLKEHWRDESCELFLQRRAWTVDVLRALVASAKCATSSRGEGLTPIPWIEKLDLSGNLELRAGDSGAEAAELIMELVRLALPELEILDVSACRLGDGAAAKIAEGVAQLPKLRRLEASNNRVGLRGKKALRRAWRRARKPNIFLFTCPEGLPDGQILDMMDGCCWGCVLPICALMLTGGYCCGLLNPDKCKTRRVADSREDDGGSLVERSFGDGSQVAGGSIGEDSAARGLPEALRMEEGRGSVGG